MTITSNLKRVGWNGLQLDVPKSWEVIVSGHWHLIFENDFSHVVELKWQNSPERNPEKLIKQIINSLEKEFGSENLKKDRGKWSKKIAGFDVTSCFWSGEKNINILLLQCIECKTTFLCRFLDSTKNVEEKVVSVLRTIKCHQKDNNLWKILDFGLTLPKDFALKTFSIKAGLTRLSFEKSSYIIHICRLAPASVHLKDSSMDQILTTLLDNTRKNVVTQIQADYVESYTSPSLLRQIRSRLKREKPFCYGRLWKNETTDRIFGFTIESIRPISQEIVTQIYSGYDISENKTETTNQ